MLLQDKRASILTPSMVHTYSLGMEYIQAWFFSKISRRSFNSIYISDSNALEPFRKYNPIDSLVANKPSLAIDSRLDMDYYQENALTPDGGLDVFLNRTKNIGCFYHDRARKLRIALNSETVRINYTFRIRLNTKMQQLEWAAIIRQACRIGETQTKDYDMDFHVPRQLMLQLAVDSGFKIVDDEIEDIYGFIRHINQFSLFPFTFKLRTVNRKMEFFVRVMDVSIHISCLDNLSIDDGERINMVKDNYGIEFNAKLTMSAPKMFIYYSEGTHGIINELDEITKDTRYAIVGVHDIRVPDIKETNDKGWNNFITADYDLTVEDDDNPDIPKEDDGYTYIDFKELIKDTDIEIVFGKCKEIYIHPKTFLDFRAYAIGKEVELEINWNTLVGRFESISYLKRVGVVLYLNKDFVNNRILDMTNTKYNRIDTRHREELRDEYVTNDHE